jgi:triphosphoribosyl-dephospho-CoA synthase
MKGDNVTAMSDQSVGLPPREAPGPGLNPGRLAQMACLLEVTAAKPGNVHRFADFADLHLVDFALSAAAIALPLDRAAAEGVGSAVLGAIEATRRVVSTNTNLGIILLLAPLAAVPASAGLAEGVEAVLAATTVDDARLVYRAIRLAHPGGLGEVSDQDVAGEPMITLRAAMALAANRDAIARQYTNGFRQVLGEALPALRESMRAGRPLETAVVTAYLHVLAQHPDSLIARKYGLDRASQVSRRAAELLDAGWPDRAEARQLCTELDLWLRHPTNRFNPGTTADLVTAALYAALREGTIELRACPIEDQLPPFESAGLS